MKLNVPNWIFAFAAALISIVMFYAFVLPGNGIRVGSFGDVGPASERKPFPIGSIIASVIPPSIFIADNPGWRLADGAEVLKGTSMERQIGSNLPDLRGMFLRGVNYGRDDNYSDPDADRPAGSLQEHALADHTHGLSVIINGNPDGSDDRFSGAYYLIHPDVNRRGNKQNLTTSSQNVASQETRPTNVAVFYYIYTGY